jgi:GNAT superfamily N-acetyltransferase
MCEWLRQDGSMARVGQLRIVKGTPDPAAVERLLRALPDWFGLEESIKEYVADAQRLPTYLAYRDGDDQAVGALLLARHFPESAEIHLMAVAPDLHRHGIGRDLLDAAEADLRAEGVRYLQVKTLGPSRPDESYEKTVWFYRAMGFTPLEEFRSLWPDNPCLLLVKSLET